MEPLYSSLKEVSWHEIRKKVMRVNATLAELIDKIDPGHHLKLFYCRYPFGSHLLSQGQFYIPDDDGQTHSLGSKKQHKKIQQELAYNNMLPLGLVLNNSIEIYLQNQQRIIPDSLLTPGKLFALPSTLDQPKVSKVGAIWNISAGARSLYMLPKIADTNSHKRLRQSYNIRSMAPRHMYQQWETFTEIAMSPQFVKPWFTEVLFFGKDWLDVRYQSHAWDELVLYFYKLAWHDSLFFRDRMAYDFILSCILEKHNLKPNPYLLDTVKHLLAIASGGMPGFSVATDDIVAPISHLQQVYIEQYNLKNYAPIMIYPQKMSADNKKNIYYSLNLPTLAVFSPKSKNYSNSLTDLLELKFIMQVLLDEIQKNKVDYQNSTLANIEKQINFDYFHHDADHEGELRDSKELALEDAELLSKPTENKQNLAFPDACSFVRGCIRIQKKI